MSNFLDEQTRKCNEVWGVLQQYPLANPYIECARLDIKFRAFSRWARRYHREEYVAWLKAATMVQLTTIVQRPAQEKWMHLVSALVYKMGRRDVYLSAAELELGEHAAVLAEIPPNGGMWVHWFRNHEELLQYFARSAPAKGTPVIIKPLPAPVHLLDTNHLSHEQQRASKANRPRSSGYYWQESGFGGNPGDKNFGPTPPAAGGNLPQHPHLPAEPGPDSNDEHDSNAA